jgi:hypothetical protein
MQASLTAIGHHLHADYSATVAKPLPRELRELVAQLVALESGKRRAAERSAQILQSAEVSQFTVAPPQPRFTDR